MMHPGKPGNGYHINIYAVDISEDSGYVGAHFAEDDGSDDDDDYNEPPQYPDNVVKPPD